MLKTVLRPETTIAELQASLGSLGIADLHLSASAHGFSARAVLHALESPCGRVTTSVYRADDLATALQEVVDAIRMFRSRRIEVAAPDGTILGLYKRTAEGRRYAERHAAAYAGATIRS